MKRKDHKDKSDAKILEPLNREELRMTAGGLAFPFIQQAMQGTTAPEEPASGR